MKLANLFASALLLFGVQAAVYASSRCKVIKSGYLTVLLLSELGKRSDAPGSTTYAGFVRGATVPSLDGKDNYSFVATEDVGGNHIERTQLFEFVQCEQEPHLPEQVPLTADEATGNKTYWGFLRRKGARKHQLGVQGTPLGRPGHPRSLIVDVKTEKTAAADRTWRAVEQAVDGQPSQFSLLLANFNATAVIRQQQFVPVQFNANGVPHDGFQLVQLVLE